jgi:hypothetical protein
MELRLEGAGNRAHDDHDHRGSCLVYGGWHDCCPDHGGFRYVQWPMTEKNKAFRLGLRSGLRLAQQLAIAMATSPQDPKIIEEVRTTYQLNDRSMVHDLSYKRGFMEGCYSMATVLGTKLEEAEER